MFVKYQRLSIDWAYCSILDTHTCFQKIYSLVILCQNTCEYENKTYFIEILIKYNKLRNTICSSATDHCNCFGFKKGDGNRIPHFYRFTFDV